MAADAFHPRTTKQRLPTPLNGTLYTTTRMVAQEKALPAIGSSMAAELGPAYADSIVIAVSEPPDKSQGVLSITHVRIPSEEDQLSSNWEQTEVPIGGKQFPAVIRSVILLASAYQDDAPAIGSALPVIATGLFEGDGYVLYDRECVKSGMEIEPTFRVDRRTYVITAAVVGQQFDPGGAIIDTSDTVVSEGTAADIGLNIAQSNVEGMGNGSASKTTQKPRRRKTDNTTEEGWPSKQKKSKGIENLTPQKYRGQTTTTVTTEQVELPAANVNDIPAPSAPTGDQTVIEHEKVNDYRYEKRITTETIAENAAALVGEEYGDIVTQSVSESLVADGTAADTGIDVISSTVDPIGNGKSVKQTKRAKAPGWPDPVTKEVSKQGPGLPPERYRKDVVVTKTSKKIAPNAIPSTPALTGKQVAKEYKLETPDRAEETITTQDLTLTMSSVDTAVERKPFVTITSTMTPGTAPVIPGTGNGSARLVHEEADGSKIYENTKEDAVARPGLKGVETNAQQWGALVSTINYTTSSLPPLGGSTNLVYNDGAVKVYESTDTYPYISGTSKDVDPQQWGSLTWNGAYSNTSSGIRSRQIWSNGVTQVFLNETPTLTIAGSSKDIDPQQWGSVTWDGTYANAPSGHRSKQVASIGGQQVFLNENATLNISGTSLDKDSQQWGIVTWTGTYSASSSGDRSRQVTSIAGQPVFLNEIATVAISGTSKDVDPQQWGSLEWNGVYAGASGGVRSRKVTSVGSNHIYLNETPTLNIASGSFVSGKENNPLYSMTDTSSFATSAIASGDLSRSRLVFAQGASRVFENIESAVVSRGARTYGTVVQFRLPAILTNLYIDTFAGNGDDINVIFNPIIEEGMEGFFPATVTERFETTPTGPTGAIISFNPAPIHISTPFGTLSIGATLHMGFSLTYTYKGLSRTITIPATTKTTWRGAGRILVAYQCDPYKNGYITREVHVTI